MRPQRSDAAEYYFTYLDQVPEGDIQAILARQASEVAVQLGAISEARSLHRYAADKWSFREVVQHLNDCERVFAFRALWFARGFEPPLPAFDQEVAARSGDADHLTWAHHLDEFRAVRQATLALFAGLPADAWSRRGIASGNPVSVTALAYIIAGHAAHHMRLLGERYG